MTKSEIHKWWAGDRNNPSCCEGVGVGYEYQKRIANLEKENAELKEKLEVVIALKDEEMGCIETDFNTFKSKAKEIIKDFLLMAKVEHLKDRYETVDEAEQFLNSEVEK